MPAPAYAPFAQSPLPARLMSVERRSPTLARAGSSRERASCSASDGARAASRIARRVASVPINDGGASGALAAGVGTVIASSAPGAGATGSRASRGAAGLRRRGTAPGRGAGSVPACGGGAGKGSSRSVTRCAGIAERRGFGDPPNSTASSRCSASTPARTPAMRDRERGRQPVTGSAFVRSRHELEQFARPASLKPSRTSRPACAACSRRGMWCACRARVRTPHWRTRTRSALRPTARTTPDHAPEAGRHPWPCA